MHTSLVAAVSLLAITASAGVIHPIHPHNISHAGDLSKKNQEQDAMHKLDQDTFRAAANPSEAQIFNAWKLHNCVSECDSKAVSNTTKIDGKYPGVLLEAVRFNQCNADYRTCNTACQTAYHLHMVDWPGKDVTWAYLTSSNMTSCVNDCNSDEAVNIEAIGHASYKPVPFADVDYSWCTQKLTKCTSKCHNYFNTEVKDFRKTLLSREL